MGPDARTIDAENSCHTCHKWSSSNVAQKLGSSYTKTLPSTPMALGNE